MSMAQQDGANSLAMAAHPLAPVHYQSDFDASTSYEHPEASPTPPPQSPIVDETVDEDLPARRQLGREPQLDDIRVETHPQNAAGKKTQFFAYDEYSSQMPKPKESSDTGRSKPADQPPWSPFRTRLDFEFADLAQSAHLNTATLDALVRLVRKIIKSPADFTFLDGKHVSQTWDAASKAYGTGVRDSRVSCAMQFHSEVYDLVDTHRRRS